VALGSPRPGFKISARTVLELGSELISSDIIAFYELVKNAFDAGSKSGVEVKFTIALRRNAYLRLRSKAEAFDGISSGETVADLKASLTERLDVTAGSDTLDKFKAVTDAATNPTEFILALDVAFRSFNTIEVIDVGSGMSFDELVDNYLVIGTPSRKRAVDQAIKDSVARTPYLGEKGIGRLSAMRLGERLRVETARKDDERINILDIDWRRFDDIEAMIEDINIEPEVGGLKPTPDYSGTRLIIGDLSEDWTEKRLAELAEYDFARLTDPFLDPKTRPRIALFWNGTRVAVPWMDRALLDHAHAKFSGKYEILDGEPVLTCTLEAINLGFPHPPEIDVVKLTLPDLEGAIIGVSDELPLSALITMGPFDFEAFWYNRRRLGGIESIGDQKAVRELQRRWSGILLFRDGFRVFPYGDDDDDWLGLDRKALGRPGYTLNKTQFVGHINISRVGNPRLVDQTNREGLRATSEQQGFIIAMQHIIQGLLWDFLRDVEKRHKHQPLDLGDVKAEVTRLEGRATTAITRIRRLVPPSEIDTIDDLQQAFLEFKDLAERAQRRIEEVEADGRQMVQMAGVGLMVEVVAHELARSSENALEALEALRGKDVPAAIKSRLDTLRAEMKSVSKRLRVLDPLSISGRQRSEVFDLVQLIEDLKEGHDAQFRRHKIDFKFASSSPSVRVRTVKGMIVQILENLISNSVYWMDLRTKREIRYVPTISVVLEGDPVSIRFTDNGRGVAAENVEKIFRPFWSQKEKAKRRGLGLFIARECAVYLGGSLTLSGIEDAETHRLHEFVLELPDAVTLR
jgi:signal transduction histidine kinase